MPEIFVNYWDFLIILEVAERHCSSRVSKYQSGYSGTHAVVYNMPDGSRIEHWSPAKSYECIYINGLVIKPKIYSEYYSIAHILHTQSYEQWSEMRKQ
jgi:hypothetical protein